MRGCSGAMRGAGEGKFTAADVLISEALLVRIRQDRTYLFSSLHYSGAMRARTGVAVLWSAFDFVGDFPIFPT